MLSQPLVRRVRLLTKRRLALRASLGSSLASVTDVVWLPMVARWLGGPPRWSQPRGGHSVLVRGLSKDEGRLEESEKKKEKSSAPRGSGSGARRGRRVGRQAAASGGGARAHIIRSARRPLPARLVLRVAGCTQLPALLSVMIFILNFAVGSGGVLRRGVSGSLMP